MSLRNVRPGLVVSLVLVALVVGFGAGATIFGLGLHASAARPSAATSSAADAAGAESGLDRPCGSLHTAPPTRFQHVIWIWMENRSYGTMIRSEHPYLESLAAECGLATNYHNLVHGSVRNYLAAVTGSLPPYDAACENLVCPQMATSLFDQVQQAGLTWRSYDEGMPRNCVLDTTGLYAVRHNPAAYFPRNHEACSRWDVPLGDASGAFASALASGGLPSFAFVTPDLCDDMHNCRAAVGESWLATWLPRIFASAAYTDGSTVVFVTWDEGEERPGAPCTGTADPQCHVATFVMSPYTPAGTRSPLLFTHYSLLGTTESLLGLPRLGAAATAADMRRDFGLQL